MITDQKTIDALKELNYSQVYEQGKVDMKKEILNLIENLFSNGELLREEIYEKLKQQINSEDENE